MYFLFAELHIFLGLVNRIFDAAHELTVERVRNKTLDKTAYKWAWESHKIVQEHYFGRKVRKYCQYISIYDINCQ